MALTVIIDGVALADDLARAFWKRFSDHMDAHKGDLAGFAKAEGYVSVHPQTTTAGASLVVSSRAPQTPYRPATGGSSTPQRAKPSRPSHSSSTPPKNKRR